MFAVAIELLTGRYTAMRFNDRTQPEWPPHPARLFSAMVAAWADSDNPDPGERNALEWLERQGPPDICCGEGRLREVVTHFVPVNDPKALTGDLSHTYELVTDSRRAVDEAERSGDGRAANRARAAMARAETRAVRDAAIAGRPTGRESGAVAAAVLEVLPDRRGKQGRTYPTVIPDRPTVWFAWPEAQPTDEHRRAVDGLLARVARLGHSSTLVACRSADSAPRATWTASDGTHENRIRVPRAGLLDRLERTYVVHQGEEPRTLPAGMVNYRRAGRPQPSRPAAPLLGGDWYVLGVAGRPPSAVWALAIARAARDALMKHGDQPSPEFISGHQRSAVEGERRTPPVERPHLACVPLLSAGHRYSDGAILGIALILPAAEHCSDADRNAIERAVRAWSEAGFQLNVSAGRDSSPTRLVLADYGVERSDPGRPTWLDTTLTERRRTTTRQYWCRTARRWLTVTPIALDRFPGNLRSRQPGTRDRAAAEARTSIARACAFSGLIREPSLVSVTIRLDSPLAGIPAAPSGPPSRGLRRFSPYLTGDGTPRVCVHAEIEFDQPVRGPVLVGAGRYLGYGLCLPADETSS
jgi:CRISPR-associated protein Csb2